MAEYHLIPAYGKKFEDSGAVIAAWESSIDFKALGEHGTYMSKSTYENYCNKLDGVIYCFDGLYVRLEAGII